MAAEEDFDQSLLYFTATLVAQLARTMDRAGALDEETYRLIHHYLRTLSAIALECDDDGETSHLLDTLVEILPPGRP